MTATITLRLIEPTYEATLKSFWRKEAPRKFLRTCRVSDGHLATWATEETKRDFLDRTFQSLQRSDAGKGLVHEMARRHSLTVL
jgi:hypothetical protein